VQFAGTSEASQERHLLFDSGIDLPAATAPTCLNQKQPFIHGQSLRLAGVLRTTPMPMEARQRSNRP
jgi:hypothetical protein